MEELIDLIATDSTPSNVSDKIKELLYMKASERVDAMKPVAASSLFDFNNDEVEETTEE